MAALAGVGRTGHTGRVLLFAVAGGGTIFLVSPFPLWWWIPGSYERYVRIISVPYPYDNLGGGPFRVMVYSGRFAAGFVLTSLALVLRLPIRNLA